MTVAIIIARKGSQRCPGKNARLLCGKPLAEWSIIQAKCSRLIDHVILATDHEHLADIARRHGCHVKWRENVKDSDPGNVPFIESMDWWEKDHGKPDAYVTILPTSMMRYPDHFDRGIERFRRGDVDAVMWAWVQKELFHAHVIYDGKEPRWSFICRFDKAWNYCTPFGGDGVCKPETYRAMTEYTIDHEGVVSAWRGMYGLVPVEQWQLPEVDTPEQFEDCEIMMRHKLLSKLGEDCYERYSQKT